MVDAMVKWILAGVGALLIGVFIYWQANTVKEAYVNGLAPYSQIPGRLYVFERNCYIFKFKHHNTDYPLVGANAPGEPMTVPALPAEVSRKFVGKDLPGVRILDVVHTGERFRIVSVRRDTRRQVSTITFEILLGNDEQRPYPRLDAYWIMDHAPEKDGKAPTILPGYAVEEFR